MALPEMRNTMSENKDRKDRPVVVDAVAFHLIPDLHRRQCLLAMPKLPERL